MAAAAHRSQQWSAGSRGLVALLATHLGVSSLLQEAEGSAKERWLEVGCPELHPILAVG